MDAWLLGTNPGLDEAYCRSILSPDEWEKAQRFHFERDRLLSMNARAALRWLLGRRLGVEPAGLRFDYEKSGRPVLAGGANSGSISFSVSHAGDRVAIAIAAFPVGVDIECNDRSVDFKSLIDFIPQIEAKQIGFLPGQDQRRAFLRSWTRKEARLKATGEGLGGMHTDDPADWLHFDISHDGYLGTVATVRECIGCRVHLSLSDVGAELIGRSLSDI